MFIKKVDFEELKAENERLKSENHRLKEFEKWHTSLVADANTTLLEILKTILFQCVNHELILDKKDFINAHEGQIYITDDMFKNAKRIQLVFEHNLIKSEEK